MALTMEKKSFAQTTTDFAVQKLPAQTRVWDSELAERVSANATKAIREKIAASNHMTQALELEPQTLPRLTPTSHSALRLMCTTTTKVGAAATWKLDSAARSEQR